MKRIFLTGLLIIATSFLWAQKADDVFSSKEAERIINVLASDEMRGRRVFTPEIDRAADIIAAEFKAAGLQAFEKDGSFRQEFVLADAGASSFSASAIPAATGQKLTNVVGIIPGKSRKNEYVIFSGHYDHLGVGLPVNNDSVFNGANDNAAGTTAVILLAKYFMQQQNNERTLVFAVFTAEESGGYGSQYFSRRIDPDKVIAMLNIEMIGTDSKWGRNSAYLTGYEKTNMGEIMAKDLEGTGFSLYPDPYPAQQLFYRSDNATLARLGVPAHTISTSKMDIEPFYHKPGDEVKTLDLDNMTRVINAIALSSKSIVSGKETPSRVKVEEPR